MAEAETFISAQQQAYAWIRDRIRAGHLVGGDRVIPEDVAAVTAVSRMPVREAIRQLDSEGLLTIRPNRGAVVTEPTPDDVLELFEMRARLEGLAMRRAIDHLDDDLEDSLVLQLRWLGRASNSVDAFIRQHQEFHRLICAAGGRAWLVGETLRLRAASAAVFYPPFRRRPDLGGARPAAAGAAVARPGRAPTRRCSNTSCPPPRS